MKSALKWLRGGAWALVGLLVLLLAAWVGVVAWVHYAAKDSLPQMDGQLHVAGLHGPVTVRRDGHGMPHIEATSLDDLLLAQGYVTAQDRLWQMDGLRRNAGGELAEVLGAGMVAHDTVQRVYQFRNVAARMYANMPDVDRHRYEQYAAGVNAWIRASAAHPPVEFRLLGYKPRPWTGQDSLLVALNMVDALDSHWDVKLDREQVHAKLNDARLEADLYPVGSWRDQPPTTAVADMTEPHPAPPIDTDDDSEHTRLALPQRGVIGGQMGGEVGEDPARLHALARAMPCMACSEAGEGELAAGSNNWAIAGKHTASGKPLLSNDMHLDLSVPNIWYMADLKAPGFHAAGVTLPGVPFVVAGHNEHVAWGITALYADTQDLYVEKLDGKGNYLAPDGSWQPLAHAKEVIHVRMGKDVTLDVQLTAHGPILTPIFQHEKRPIALHWTIYDPAVGSAPIYEMNTAANANEFTRALDGWAYPTLNMIYADEQHIAYHAVGMVPSRPHGLMGMPILDQEHEWEGYVPFDGMPHAYDPPSGLLATANSRVTPNDTQYPLTLEWATPYRAERIYADLKGRNGLTRADMLAVQTDIYSAVDEELAQRLVYAIDHTPSAEPRVKEAADLMRSWNGRLERDSAAASVVEWSLKSFWDIVLRNKLGDAAASYRWSEGLYAEEEVLMHGGALADGARSPWLPASYADWNALLTDAVRQGLAEGKAPGELNHWKYGSWHVVDLEHPLLGMIPGLKDWSGTGAEPQSGDGSTIKQVGRAFGPSQRFTMDWSAVDSSTEDITLGQSGNPASRWFRDQWPYWYEGTTFAMPFTDEAVKAATQHTLELRP